MTISFSRRTLLRGDNEHKNVEHYNCTWHSFTELEQGARA